MSPTITSLPAQPKGIKGKRVEGRRGRFDPTEPLHMKTRGAAKKSGSSGNGSVEDFASRRPSLDVERPVTANSNGTQTSKATYASEFSPPQPVPDIEMVEAPLFTPADEGINGERTARSPFRDQQTSPFSKKRKRTSPSPPSAPPTNDIDRTEDRVSAAVLAEDDYDSDTVQVIRQDELSDREESDDEVVENKEDDSPASSQSQEVLLPYDAMVGTSVDITPMLSEQASPATSGSGDEDDPGQNTTIAKPLAEALKEVAEATKDSLVEPVQPEDEPMLEVVQAIEDADEIEEQVRTDDDGRMVVRRGRFGGRRRAQHPDINIEVAMRRQAQLKSAYRAMARAQKSLVAEVTQRSLEHLETNPDYHTEAEEYEDIVGALDAALAKRKAVIQAQHDMRLKQLKTTWDGEQEAIVSKCRQQLEDVEESKVGQLQYEFLRIARTAQLEDGNETEDEDDVIPRLKRTAYHFKRASGLGPAFDSRSRLAIETQRAAEDMQARYNMYEMLKNLPDEDKPEKRRDFTVMDDRPKTAASTNREGQDNLDVLAAAGAEAERIANIPVIPNEQALGLQMLGDLASRPSIVGSRPQSSGSISGQMPSATGPPQLHLQVPTGSTPIQVQMSPRTQNAMGGRFEPGQMPPPLTPRQDALNVFNRSREARRHDRRPSSPGAEERPYGLHAQPGSEILLSPARPPIRDPETLHNRIASRDGMLQNSLFGFGSPRGLPDFGNWRQYDDVPGGPRRRAASHSGPAPPFVIRSDPALDESRREQERREPQRSILNDDVKDESPRLGPGISSTIKWPDSWSQSGVSNGRSRGTASPKSEQLSLAGTPGPQQSAGLGQGGAQGRRNSRHEHNDSKEFPLKTNVMQRQGKSRRQVQKDKKLQREQQTLENGRSESTGAPTIGSAGYANSPVTSMGPPSPYFGPPPPMYSPREYQPPGPHHHSSSYGGPPLHHGFPPAPHHHMPMGYDHHHHQHRPSLPFAALGMHPPGSPLFPGAPPPPPPPGVDAAQWTREFRPPPPPPHGFQYQPPHIPQTPHPQSAPGTGSMGNHFRGPAIAPAGFLQGGHRQGNPLPAFAQQQQQNGGSQNGGSRRRTQSDVTFPKFQPPWKPKSPRQ